MINKLHFKNLFTLLDNNQKKSALVLVLLQIIGMIFEMLGIGMIIPIITAVLNVEMLMGIPQFVEFINMLGNPNQATIVTLLLLGLIIIYFIKVIFSMILVWKQSSFAQNLAKSVAKNLYKNYLNKPYIFHLNNNSSILIRNIIGEIPVLIKLITGLLILQTEIAITLGISLVFIVAEPESALITIIFIIFSGLLMHKFTREKLRKYALARMKSEKLLTKSLYEGLVGVKILKVLGKESFFIKKFTFNNDISNDIAIRVGFFQRIPRLMFELITVIGLVTFVLISLKINANTSELIAKLGLFAFGAFRIMPSFATIVTTFQTVSNTIPVLELLSSELDVITDIPEINPKTKFSGDIQLKNLSFRYSDEEQYILNEINFHIQLGEKIGIIGSSGSGKSTLVDLIMGLLKQSSGHILSGSNPITHNLREWQNMIGYVPQEIHLIDDTLASNIAFGLESEQIDYKKVYVALENSRLIELVDNLPERLNTVIGENGARLSGGQKQRLGIARALYKNPSIMVFDEATSALDNETEQNLMKTIEDLGQNKTIILVAHRISTLMNCDRIFEVVKGNVIEVDKQVLFK